MGGLCRKYNRGRLRLASLELAAIKTMDRLECIDHWRVEFGHSPPKHVSLQFMRKVLVFEAQVKAHGGHSALVRKALERSLKDGGRPVFGGKSPLEAAAPSLRPGTHLVREWNGRSYQVEVMDSGFQMDGKQYRSLSAIARKITGAHWSGPRFFGLDVS